MIKRLDRIDVCTTDLEDAKAIFERNFGFAVHRVTGSDDATIVIGDAEIRLRSGASVASVIAGAGEGLAAVWLEAEDLDQIQAALQYAGLGYKPPRTEGGRRIIEIDASVANMVPLLIFDRRV
jgi:hypothetical protein